MTEITCTICNTAFEASKGYSTYCYDCANFSDQIPVWIDKDGETYTDTDAKREYDDHLNREHESTAGEFDPHYAEAFQHKSPFEYQTGMDEFLAGTGWERFSADHEWAV